MNHRWLSGRFLTFLEASIVEPGNKDRVILQLGQWKEKRSRFDDLIENAVDALSPAQLLDKAPLNKLPEPDKKWLRSLIHELYLKRTNIKTTMAKIKTLQKDIDRRVDRTIKGMNNPGKEVDFPGLYHAVKEFHNKISRLPKRIQVI